MHGLKGGLQAHLWILDYVGTTGHTHHARNVQHLRALETGDMAYPMTKLMAAEHAGAEDSGKTFSTRILGSTHMWRNLIKYLTEAVALSEE